MDAAIDVVMWPIKLVKALVTMLCPARTEEEDGPTDPRDNWCISLLSSCGSGVPLGSLYRAPPPDDRV